MPLSPSLVHVCRAMQPYHRHLFLSKMILHSFIRYFHQMFHIRIELFAIKCFVCLYIFIHHLPDIGLEFLILWSGISIFIIGGHVLFRNLCVGNWTVDKIGWVNCGKNYSRALYHRRLCISGLSMDKIPSFFLSVRLHSLKAAYPEMCSTKTLIGK